LLEIDSIIKNFGTRQLLTDVYLKINTGDVIGLFGRNGTGKSVLMQIIFGTMKADRKFIRLDECKVLSAPYQHARTIAFLPQQGYLPKHEKIKKLFTAGIFSERTRVLLPIHYNGNTIRSQFHTYPIFTRYGLPKDI